MDKNNFSALIAVLMIGIPSYAQEKADSVNLDEVVVTANQHKTLRRQPRFCGN